MHRNIRSKAELYATKMHAKINHMYDVHPYRYHLKMVVTFAEEFIHLIPKEDQDTVIAGCWVHDAIEDAHASYNDVKNNTNETVAEYAYALTNEKGRTRKERANDKYYIGILEYRHASFVKICDRMANVTYSKSHNKKMFKMYKKEHEYFKTKLYDGRWDEMWDALENIFKN